MSPAPTIQSGPRAHQPRGARLALQCFRAGLNDRFEVRPWDWLAGSEIWGGLYPAPPAVQGGGDGGPGRRAASFFGSAAGQQHPSATAEIPVSPAPRREGRPEERERIEAQKRIADLRDLEARRTPPKPDYDVRMVMHKEREREICLGGICDWHRRFRRPQFQIVG